MKVKEVEIYSDASNFAIMRHPGRKFPGALIQGDSLAILCNQADAVRKFIAEEDYEEALEGFDDLRAELWNRLKHYESVLNEHEIKHPYSARSPAPDIPEFD